MSENRLIMKRFCGGFGDENEVCTKLILDYLGLRISYEKGSTTYCDDPYCSGHSDTHMVLEKSEKMK